MGILASPSATRALSLLLLSTCAAAKANEAAMAHDRSGESKVQVAGGADAVPLSANSSIRDLLNHPAFSGFGRLILPWDDRAYDETMRLAEIGSLLPYHTQVRPETVVGALNRMIDDVGKGRTVFYDFYTEVQKREDPTKEHTGLFFFRGKPGAPFAVIAPGGGFSYVGSVHEGFPYAVEISSKGYNAFVLKYRAGQGGAVATQDLAAAHLLHLRECRHARGRYRKAIPCGAAPRERGWLRRSARTASPASEGRTCRSRLLS